MSSEIIDLLIMGKVDDAKALLDNKDVSLNGIQQWVHRTSNITIYTLVASMLVKEETAEEHAQASFILAMPLFAYKGAYSLGLFHARRALALDPSNLEHKRFLILFHDIPEQLIKKDEAIKIAQEVLKEDPDCGVSLNILERYGLTRKN